MCYSSNHRFIIRSQACWNTATDDLPFAEAIISVYKGKVNTGFPSEARSVRCKKPLKTETTASPPFDEKEK